MDPGLEVHCTWCCLPVLFATAVVSRGSVRAVERRRRTKCVRTHVGEVQPVSYIQFG